MVTVPLGSGNQRKGVLFVYIQGGSSKLFLSSSLDINIFLKSNICTKKAKEADSETDIIQVFKNIQNVFYFPPRFRQENATVFTRCLN
jgi:hypothetical protein